MSARIIVQTPDIENLGKALRRAPEVVKRELADAVSRSAITVERNAKIEAPVKTGRLRASIYTRYAGNNAIISPNTDYAEKVHRRNAYMKRAAERSTPDIQRFFKNAADRIAKQVFK